VIAVKAPSLPDALGRIDPALLVGSAILPLLNGLEHVAMLRGWLERRGASRPPIVLAGSIGRLEALSPRPGVVEQRTPGALVTVASDVLDVLAVEAAIAPLQVPGIEVVLGESERAVLWEKAARLAVLAAATVASGLPVGALRADAVWRARLGQALAEACATATADGVSLDPAAQWAIIEAMPETLTTSAARDAAAGRATELDAISGSVVRAARRVGVPTPELERLLVEAQGRCRPR
jgi:2-dehydropantoate 2-reductase